MSTAYLIAAIVIFFLLFLIWSRNSWLNLTIKAAFFGMAGWSAFYLFRLLGYIVQL